MIETSVMKELQTPEQRPLPPSWNSSNGLKLKSINPYYATVPFLRPLKKIENQKFSFIFRGYSVRRNGLRCFYMIAAVLVSLL